MHFLSDLRRTLPSRLAAFSAAGLLAFSLSGCATQANTGAPVRLTKRRASR
jgi:hypothetical protein